ncbi:CoA transferase [Pseudophaeobacter flagellatus]|uniref:CoA transferase n=1 Tax=Pseudophaeobacter flagellatus TaxID=2899119 RepID=UPI001E420F1C|nr:CoA transferase [Pseudophaeobacter flagellatus]MCD9146232.1 CoA transferase [Pseudophaeobacter flagellatus]
MLLGDLGATVVHIAPPDGPVLDSPANAILMRNKLIVNLDLKSDDGLAKARALCAEADIIVENLRPGKLDALGIDFAAMRKESPSRSSALRRTIWNDASSAPLKAPSRPVPACSPTWGYTSNPRREFRWPYRH